MVVKILIDCFLFVILVTLFQYKMCKSLNFKVLPATDWHDAVSRCDAIGMRLAKIKSPKIQLEINRLFEEGFIASSFEPWIGLHWRAYDQSFYWIDGEEMVFSNWFPPSTEPDGMQDFSTVQDDSNANENCVRVVGGFWRTRECNELQHVLCMGYETTSPISTFKDVTISLSSAGDQTRLPTTTNGPNAPSVTTDNTQSSAKSTNLREGPSVTMDTKTTTGIADDDSVQMSVKTSPKTEPTTFTDDSVVNMTMSGTRAIVFCPYEVTNICECKIIQNISVVMNGEFGDYIYRIDKKKTSSYRRKHNSAHDGRFSARCIGLTGSAVLGVVVLFIIVLDIKRMSNRHQKKN